MPKIFEYLKSIGLSGFAALVIAEYPQNESTLKKMIPQWYHHNVSLENFKKDLSFISTVQKTNDFVITPYLDSRFIGANIDEKVSHYYHMGYKGLKLLYIPEPDNGMGVAGMHEAFGRPPAQSERISTQLIDNADRYGMPVLLHIDLRKYEPFARAMLSNFPGTNFNIAHLGFSRRKISTLLDKYENCYSDLSGLTPFIEKDFAGYRAFISRHQDRILFGSDAIIEHPQQVNDAKSAINNGLGDTLLSEKIFNKNYHRFHGNGILKVGPTNTTG